MGSSVFPTRSYAKQDRNAPRARRPVVGVMCCNNMVNGRRSQTAATRFIEPLHQISDVSVLLVPAIADAADVASFVPLLDGLLLTGSCSNVAPSRYGGDAMSEALDAGDAGRDAVALALAEGMIEAGRPVFGICRGLQELNVLFGGTLSDVADDAGHHYLPDQAPSLQALFDHRHAIDIVEGGLLARIAEPGMTVVNSVHRQGIDRLGSELHVEAFASDGLIEAISASPCGATVLGVQWHPEWDVAHNATSRKFFELLGQSISRRAEPPLEIQRRDGE